MSWKTTLMIAVPLVGAACTCDPIYPSENDAVVRIEVAGSVFGTPFLFVDDDASIITPATGGGPDRITVADDSRYKLVISGHLPIIEGSVNEDLTHLRFGSVDTGTNWGLVGGNGERAEVTHVGSNPFCEYTIAFEALNEFEALSWCDTPDAMSCADWATGMGAMEGLVIVECANPDA